jgi:hypothetical protein
VRTLEWYADQYARMGLVEFRREHGRPVLIGLGIIGELRDGNRGPTGTLRMQAASGPVAAESLVGRIWLVTKGQNGPRGPAITGGRASSNDIVLPEFTISNHHFHLRYEATRYVVIDLGSTNGTYVNGERTDQGKRVPVASGARIVFGRYQFEFMTAPEFVRNAAEVAGESLDEPAESLRSR